MPTCIRIYYSNVSYCSTCFERHIARHQELKTVFAASGLHTSVVAGRCQRSATTDVCKPEVANTGFELLMMSDVSLETC